MNVRELIEELQKYARDLQVAIDVDDGLKGNYKDVFKIKVITNAIGAPFLAIESDFVEEPKHFRINRE